MGERKIALVTGGSRGIGRAICERLASDGMDIVFSYRSGSEAAKETQKECEAKGAKVLAVCADASDPAACSELIDKAMEFGGHIDVLVNNAGITKDNLLLRISDDDLNSVLNVNLKGPFYMMRGVIKIMLKQRAGRIINMSSVVGLHGNAGQVNYAASKAAVIGMTKSLAKEVASRQITVNAVAPGMIGTDMTGAMTDAAKDKILESIPFGKIGKAEDVAGVVSFLAGDDAAYITGQVISVDGGMAI
ncbi:MAG: 3-oxoacyl-[acyl-carrier-protein] reductase [Lachnospiraceae bacterium]|nr:3-oxoacyl-[acyl-carrier-protein] reductase [Lachnospiraceae bacterium]